MHIPTPLAGIPRRFLFFTASPEKRAPNANTADNQTWKPKSKPVRKKLSVTDAHTRLTSQFATSISVTNHTVAAVVLFFSLEKKIGQTDKHEHDSHTQLIYAVDTRHGNLQNIYIFFVVAVWAIVCIPFSTLEKIKYYKSFGDIGEWVWNLIFALLRWSWVLAIKMGDAGNHTIYRIIRDSTWYTSTQYLYDLLIPLFEYLSFLPTNDPSEEFSLFFST